MDLLIGLVRIDNEDNAVLCIKIITDIMPQQAKILVDKGQTTLALINLMLDQIYLVVRAQLDSQASQKPRLRMPLSGPHGNSSRPHASVASISDIALDQRTLPSLKAITSLKVLSGWPTIAQSMLENYKPLDRRDIDLIFPHIMSTLLLRAKPQEKADAAVMEGTIFIGINPNVKNKALFAELIMTQVNAARLLAYLLRACREQTRRV